MNNIERDTANASLIARLIIAAMPTSSLDETASAIREAWEDFSDDDRKRIARATYRIDFDRRAGARLRLDLLMNNPEIDLYRYR